MRLLTAIFMLVFSPGMLLQSMFRAQNVISNTGPTSPTYETGCAVTVASGGTSTCTFTLVGGEGVGIWQEWGGTSTTTVVDSAVGNTVVGALSGGPIVFNTSVHANLLYIQNATAGAHTLSVNFTPTNAAYQIAAVVYSGASTTSLIDGTPTGMAFTNATNPFTCPAITTTQTNGVIIGAAIEASGSIILNPGTGFTTRQKVIAEQLMEDKPTTTVGSYAASFITTTTTAAACVSMVFKHA
jgi:hypothetical protein